MFSIERKPFGYALTFAGVMGGQEMAEWLEASTLELRDRSPSSSFCVFVDMRQLKPLAEDAQILMQRGQRLFKEKGMERSVVILDNPVTTIQFKRIAKETRIYDWERYIDASKLPDWEEVGMRWLAGGIDPDAGSDPKPAAGLTFRGNSD